VKTWHYVLLVAVILTASSIACCGSGTAGGNPTPQPSTTMYICGYDRCENSGEYGKLIFETNINVWNNTDPDRGGVRRKVNHGDAVEVVEEKRVGEGSGTLWYRLKKGGWINDLWVTDVKCTGENLGDLSLSDC